MTTSKRFTLSSSAISRTTSSRSASPDRAADAIARGSGWRTPILASFLAAAPERHELARDLHLRLERVVDRGLVDGRPVGDVHGIRRRRRGCAYISSVMNGQNGASSCEIVVRHSWSVACAAGSDDFQNRGRERRTYQFDRSSTSSASACAPLNESKASSESVTVRDRAVQPGTDPPVEDVRATRPVRARSVAASSSRFAYVTKNE